MEIHKTPFENQTYSQSCHELFTIDDPWQEYDTQLESYQRMYWRRQEYADYPNSYDIAQFALDFGFNEKHYLVHTLYIVASLSLEADDDGFRKVDQWFISNDIFGSKEQVNYISTILHPDLDAEKLRQNGNDNFRFAVESGLAQPNDTDLLELGWVLEILKHGKQNSNQ